MKNWRKKDIIKNSLRIVGFLCFMVYIGAIDINMARRCAGYPNESGCSRIFRGVGGVPCPNCPEETVNLHENILNAAATRIFTDVDWINRTWVLTDDGNYHNRYGLGYAGGDDISSFRNKLDPLYTGEEMLWSKYPCSPPEGPYAPPPDKFRPGYRWYANYDCRPINGGDPCCPTDANYPPGTAECSWTWTGAWCFYFVAYSLYEADGTKFIAFKSPSFYGCSYVYNTIIDNNLGKECSRDEAIPGDLVFYHISPGNDPSFDHVAILKRKGAFYDADRQIGSLGYYSSPFLYKAGISTNYEINWSLSLEWDPIAHDNNWGAFENGGRTKYVHIYEYGEP